MSVPSAIIQAARVAVPDDLVVDVRPAEIPPRRYALIEPDNGQWSRPAYNGAADTTEFRWSLLCVGPTRQDAQWLAGKIIRDWLTVRLVEPGWRCALPVQELSRAAAPDEAVTARPIVFTVDQFSMLAHSLPV